MKVKYISILIIFTAAFLGLMSYTLVKFRSLTDKYSITSLNGRLKSIHAFYVDLGGWGVRDSLVLEDDYESDFDEYWEFAKIEDEYVKGIALKRAIEEGDATKKESLALCISNISNYLSRNSNSYFTACAQAYLNDLSQ